MKLFKLKLPVQEDFTDKLSRNRRMPYCPLPVKNEVHDFANDMLAILFPHFSKKTFYSPEEIKAEITLQNVKLERILDPCIREQDCSAKPYVETFINELPRIHRNLLLDADAIHAGDPAAENVDEVILSYPGFLAIAIYRIAHKFYEMDVPLFPRILTEYAHQLTGIDIHPGAEIGNSFCIDHGTGIVIGETTHIGDNVKLYQGVTLGALSVEKSLAKQKRHPTIKDEVVIYAGATILGGKTVIGKGSVIGGNAWLTESVPPNSVVYNKSEVRVRNHKENSEAPVDFVI